MFRKHKPTLSAPPGWLCILVEEANFEKAFNALEGYDHFHTETLRGRIRSLQLRTNEAFEHFDKAEELSRDFDKSEDNLKRLFYLYGYLLDNSFLEEAISSSTDVFPRTEVALRKLLEFEVPEEPIHDQIRSHLSAIHHLVRGDYEASMRTFEALIEESRFRLQDQRAFFFIGAAGSAMALGLEDTAERNYENAAFLAKLFNQPFKAGLHIAQLYTMMNHWDREEEARDWLNVLERLNCPEESRRCFIERAKVLTAATKLRERLFIA